MAKPKAFDSWPPEQQEAWREKYREAARKYRAANRDKKREADRKRREANLEKYRERNRKWREVNPEKSREACRKWYKANCQQAAADQFFVMAGAAQQISEAIGKPNQKTK